MHRTSIAVVLLIIVAGIFLANTIAHQFAPSASSGLVISRQVNANPNSIHLQGILGPNAVGAFSSCYDTDGGKNPGEPGATISVTTSQPIVGADSRAVLSRITSITPNDSLNGTQRKAFNITYKDNGREYKGFLSVAWDNGSYADNITNDHPVGSEPGTAPDTPPTPTQTAVLSEQYCYYYTATGVNGQAYPNSNPLSTNFAGKVLDDDYIDYPPGFYDSIVNHPAAASAPTTDYFIPENADYLAR